MEPIHKSILCLSLVLIISGCCPKDKIDTWQNCRALADVVDEADCLEHSVKEADAELDRTYNQLMAKISPKGQARLRELEMHWFAYRKAQCEFNVASLEGMSHTAWSTNFDDCYWYITTQHIKELRSQLHCEEGVIACGGQ